MGEDGAMTEGLSMQQRRDVRLLTEKHHYSYAEALMTVLRPKRRIRAPTMKELEDMQKKARKGSKA